MPTLPVLKARGLYTGDNALSAVPDGAFVRADNVVIPALDVLEPRRGQRYETNGFGIAGSRSRSMAFFRSGKVVLYGTTLAYNTTADGAYTDNTGSYTEADSTLLRMKFVEMAENLYFNTSLGLYLKETLSATPRAAGVPKPVTSYAGANASIGSWLAADRAVSYVVVFGIKDANSNVKLGPPSDVIHVTTGTRTFPIGSITRTAPDGTHPAGKVTATIPLRLADYALNEYSSIGSISISPGEANFAVGAKTLVDITGQTAFSWDEAGANVSNTVAQVITISVSRGVTVSVLLPSGVSSTSGHFVRLYRTKSVAGATNLPGLDMFLVAEKYISLADDGFGFTVFNDDTPDIMLEGAPPLYTSPNFGDGIGAAKLAPPLAKDIFEFDGRAFLVNTTDKHRFFLNLLGTGSPNGVQNADSINIAGRSYVFKTAPGAGEVRLFSSFSVAQNIEDNARALVAAINADSGNTLVNAYYVSGIDDAPGRILVESRLLGASSFAVYASRATSWFPALPTSGSTVTSDNSRRAHGVSFSPVGEPEAVPLTNYVDGIPRGREAIRGVALRDKAYVLVKDVGIYELTGPAPYRLTKLDTTAKPLVPDTFVEHSNQLIGLTDQGVVSISEGGVRILASPIELDLRELVGLYLANVKARAFAVSHEADRQYQLWLPDDASDTSATFAWVYNSLRNAWTKWTGNRACGGVNPVDGLLCLGDGATNKIRLERRAYTAADYSDETLTVNVTGIGAGNLSATLASATGVAAGDVLTNSSGGNAKLITAVNGNTVTLIVSDSGSIPTGAACLVWKAIACDVKYVPPRTADPAILKQFREVSFHFARLSAYALASYFDSEKGHIETTGKTFRTSDYNIPGAATAKALLSANKRAEVPIQHQRSTQLQVGLRITEAWSRWRLNGYSLTYDPLTEKSED